MYVPQSAALCLEPEAMCANSWALSPQHEDFGTKLYALTSKPWLITKTPNRRNRNSNYILEALNHKLYGSICKPETINLEQKRATINFRLPTNPNCKTQYTRAKHSRLTWRVRIRAPWARVHGLVPGIWSSIFNKHAFKILQALDTCWIHFGYIF